ncbi:MAG: hypothetical protein QW112_02650 [Candidatus Micrarchaeia archaeon]
MMPKKQKIDVGLTPEKVGAWAFILGVVLAIIIGAAGKYIGMPVTSTSVVLVLGLLGIIVGVLNVTDREVGLFLIATIAFLSAVAALDRVLSVIPVVGDILIPILGCVALFVAPGAAIIALKALFDISRARYV